MSGGGGQTSTTNNQPPQVFLDAYKGVMDRATGVANTPLTQYNGQLQAGFSPLQQQGFDTIASAPGVSAPYINQAAQNFTDANKPLAASMQPYVNDAFGQFQRAGGADLQGALTPYQQQAQAGFAGGSQAINPNQYSAAAIQGFQSPYTQQVVDATQAQFNQQNAQAQTSLQGNAASRGALGGDRLGVAQAQLAGQQQMAQAPVIAGLRNSGFNQAQQEFNQQQQTALGAQQNTAARQLQGAQGMAGLGQQSMTAAQQQAAIAQAAGTGFSTLGQQELGAAQGQGWLAAQTGAGMAGLGNQALSSTLAAGNAQLTTGALQQAQAQQALNIPYQQFLQQQAYPYQQTSWLSNIAQGLGSGAGGSSSTTAPGASALSQVGGLGVAGVGLYNSLSRGGGGGAGAGAGGMAAGSELAGLSSEATANVSAGAAGLRRGGAVGFAGGGDVGLDDLTIDGAEVPDAGTSIVPSGDAGGVSTMKRDYGSTTTTEVPHDSIFGTILKTAGEIAAAYYGGPAGYTAAHTASSQVHFDRGGRAGRGFAGGGDVIAAQSGALSGLDDGNAVPGNVDVTQSDGPGVPNLRRSYVPTTSPSRRGSLGPPKPPAAAKAENLGDEAQKLAGDAKTVGLFGNKSDADGFAGGGGLPLLRKGFAAGGSPAISVASVPNERGVGVPTMVVDPSVTRSSASTAGSASSQLADYLAKTTAGGHQTTPTPPPAAAPTTPAPNALTQDQISQLQGYIARQEAVQSAASNPLMNGDGGGGQARGGVVGFAGGGDVDAPAEDYKPDGFDIRNIIPPEGKVWSDRPLPEARADRTAPEAPHPEVRGQWPTRQAAPDAPPDAPADAPPADDVPLPPAPPPGTARSSPAGGFARPPARIGAGGPNPSLGGLRSPADTDQPASAAPPRSTPDRPPPRDPLTGFYADALAKSRALKEDRADPWLALATAGFATAAGTSPQAGVNIGAGGLAGIKQYVSADRSAKELAARVDESRARLAESQAYHESTLATRNYGIDTRAATATANRDNAMAMAMARIAAQADRAGQHITTGDLMAHAAASLRGQTNPDTGKPYTEMEIFHEANGLTARTDLGNRRADQGDERIRQGDERNRQADRRLEMMQQHNTWVQQHGDASLDQQKAHYDDLKAKGATDEDLRALGLSKDILGKPTMTPDQAHDAAERLRGRNRPAPASTPKPSFAVPPDAIAHLQAHPELATAFDAKYGAGSAASALGQ